jgi:hypothetical protein
MGIAVMIMGESGTGKSTSIRNFKNAGIINVYGKPLPFKSNVKPTNLDDCNKIINAMKNEKSNIIVIDDFQGLLVTQYMGRAKEQGYQKYTDMALGYYNVIRTVQSLPPEKRVYFLSHIERDPNGNEKVKTIGKLLDEKITVEGLFTVVLKTTVIEKNYYFYTHNSGSDTVKSPIGMFNDDLIPNDLAIVDRAICDYYQIETNPGETAPPQTTPTAQTNKPKTERQKIIDSIAMILTATTPDTTDFFTNEEKNNTKADIAKTKDIEGLKKLASGFENELKKRKAEYKPIPFEDASVSTSKTVETQTVQEEQDNTTATENQSGKEGNDFVDDIPWDENDKSGKGKKQHPSLKDELDRIRNQNIEGGSAENETAEETVTSDELDIF